MGIKKRKFVYESDRGQEFEIDEMASSHLMNAINHHENQFQVVFGILKGGEYDPLHQRNLEARMQELQSTINALSQELASRHPDNDEEYKNRGHDHW